MRRLLMACDKVMTIILTELKQAGYGVFYIDTLCRYC